MYITKSSRNNKLCEKYWKVQQHAVITADKLPLMKPVKYAIS